MVLLVIIRKEVGNPVSGLSEKDGWLWEGGGENRVVGPREQSKYGGKGPRGIHLVYTWLHEKSMNGTPT